MARNPLVQDYARSPVYRHIYHMLARWIVLNRGVIMEKGGATVTLSTALSCGEGGNRNSHYTMYTKLAMWSVRNLFMTGKLANVEEEIHYLKNKILGLSEVRWSGSGSHRTSYGMLYYSGGEDCDHQYGVTIVV